MDSAVLDTHVLAWWRHDPSKLRRDQDRLLRDLERRGIPLAISAITLREIAFLVERGRIQVLVSLDDWF